MRKVSCKIDGERWSTRRSSVFTWYHQHLKRHHLLEPRPSPNEETQHYIDRLTRWRQLYFDDSNFPEEGVAQVEQPTYNRHKASGLRKVAPIQEAPPAPKTKLVCGKCGADWGQGSPAWCPACLTSSFAIAVEGG